MPRCRHFLKLINKAQPSQLFTVYGCGYAINYVFNILITSPLVTRLNTVQKGNDQRYLHSCTANHKHKPGGKGYVQRYLSYRNHHYNWHLCWQLLQGGEGLSGNKNE